MVAAWTTLGSEPAIDLQKMLILEKNHIFKASSFCSWRVCKQAKLSLLGYRKPAHKDWKADAPKTSHCLVRILVQRHNWAIFLRKWARRDRYSQWRSLSEKYVVICSWDKNLSDHNLSLKNEKVSVAFSIILHDQPY